MTAPQYADHFLKTLVGSDSVSFQTFSDRDTLKVKQPGRRYYDPNAHILHGNLRQHEATFESLNHKGAGIFVMVNAGDGHGRSAKNVRQVRALFIDTDGTPYPTDIPLRPHLIVQSSPGRWHVYWKVDGLELTDFSTLQKALAEHYGADPSVHDLPRVMRLPGFYHHKVEPVMVQLLEAHDHEPYSPTNVFTAWPSLLERLERERALAVVKERSELLEHAAERHATTRKGDQARAERLLQAHHSTVASAPEGQRHDTLKRHARALGGYVGSGTIAADDAREALATAAEICGLPNAEAAEVITWGLEKGAAAPLALEQNASESFGAVNLFNAPTIALKDLRLGQQKPSLGFSGSGFSSSLRLGGKPCL